MIGLRVPAWWSRARRGEPFAERLGVAPCVVTDEEHVLVGAGLGNGWGTRSLAQGVVIMVAVLHQRAAIVCTTMRAVLPESNIIKPPQKQLRAGCPPPYVAALTLVRVIAFARPRRGVQCMHTFAVAGASLASATTGRVVQHICWCHAEAATGVGSRGKED